MQKYGYTYTYDGETTKYIEVMNLGNTPFYVNDIYVDSNERKVVQFKDSSNELYFTGEGQLDFVVHNPTISNDEYTLNYEFKGFTHTNHVVKPFELTQGSTMLPIDQIDMTWDYGDNVSIGSGDSLLRLENIELIKDYREELLPLIYNNLSGLSYNEYDIQYPGDPFINIGDIVKSIDKDGYTHEVYVTSKKFKDNGAWGGEIAAHIVDAEEVETNYVGTYDKAIKETNIRVDKVTGEIIIKVQENSNDISEDRTQLGQITVKVNEIEQIVSNIDTTSNIIANINGFNGYKGYSWANSGGLRAVSGLKALEGLRTSTTWQPIPIDSEAIVKKSYFTSGDDIFQGAFATGGEDYSYNGIVVGGTQTFDVIFREYDNMGGAFVKETIRTIGGVLGNHATTIKLQPSTKFLIPVIRTSASVTPTNRLELTEQVINKGMPGEFKFQVAEFVNKTEAKITVLDNQVQQAVTQVGIFNGELVDINNSITVNAQGIQSKVSRNAVISTINQSAEELKIDIGKVNITGLVTINALRGEGQTIINGSNITTGTIQADRINFNGAVGNNVTLTGTITATRGNIGGWTISNNGNDLAFGIGTPSEMVLQPNGGIWLGGNSGNAPFFVSKTGSIRATSGNIGNYSILNGSLVGNDVILSSSRVSIGTVILEGAKSIDNIPFLSVTGVLRTSGQLQSADTAFMMGGLQVIGNTSINGTTTINGQSIFKKGVFAETDLVVEGTAVMKGQLQVKDASFMETTLRVTGTTFLDSNVWVEGTMYLMLGGQLRSVIRDANGFLKA